MKVCIVRRPLCAAWSTVNPHQREPTAYSSCTCRLKSNTIPSPIPQPCSPVIRRSFPHSLIFKYCAGEGSLTHRFTTHLCICDRFHIKRMFQSSLTTPIHASRLTRHASLVTHHSTPPPYQPSQPTQIQSTPLTHIRTSPNPRRI